MRRLTIIATAALLIAGAVVFAAPNRAVPPSYFKSYAGLVWNPQDHYWLSAQREVQKSVLSLVVQDQAERTQGLKFRKIMRGAPQDREVALTFDDGPHPAYTPQLLAILHQYSVKATFFTVGERAEQFPYLVRDEVAQGHEVGNHTYHHVNLTKITPVQAAVEIQACGDVLRAITGHTPHLFRPPGGDYNADVAADADALGYTTVLWTDDPKDYTNPGSDVIAQRTLGRVSPGAIILLHDGIQQTITVLPQLIQTIRAEGYKFVTVDQLIADHNHQQHLQLAAEHKARLLASRNAPRLLQTAGE